MKVMDESMETEDCAMTIPPKKKKMIQALLPFQILSASGSPKEQSTKKRKHMSPSPGESRNSKIVRIGTNENSKANEGSSATVDEKKSSDDTVEIVDDSSMESENSVKKSTNDNEEDNPSRKEEETKDSEEETKSSGTSGFLERVSERKKFEPVVLLTRCDNDSVNANVACKISHNSSNDDKLVAIKSDESSSNDELAKELEDSEDDNCDNVEKDKSDTSSDIHAGNSDSESDIGISSSDDESDEQKRNKGNEGQDEMSANGSSFDRTPTSNVKSDGNSAARRRLTPKQLEKKMETVKRREERRMERLEKEKKREAERLVRKKEKEERRREKKKKEEAEKEQKRKEKEQKELKKQMEIEQKQRDKERRDRAKEEDRKKREEAKEEEKRKKEEERLEAERKKRKAASTFASFFVPKKSEGKITEEKKLVTTCYFMPFQVKADMRLAPLSRRSLNNNEKTQFDEVCIDKLNGDERLYVREIKSREKRKSAKTWPPESKDDVVVIEDDEVGTCNMIDQTNATIEKQRAKLLAFAENRRPPYWGTWRKRSAVVTPRRPFSKDTKWFDYDVDSDEEWEEEEPGESLRGSDDEKDEENPDDNEYDVDNEFMVPHGYLSDEEAQADEDEEDMSPETQKFKLKILGEEFEAERKTQPSKIKPKVVGCIWQGPVNVFPANLPQKLVDFLTARQAWVRETPIMLAPPAVENPSGLENTGASGEERRGPKKTKVPEEALPELIRLIHGNTHGSGFLVREFMTFWNRKKGNEKSYPLSKSSLGQKIRELAKRMACPEEGPMHLKACWYVSEETRKEYLGDETLELPNCWNYALTPKRKSIVETVKPIEKQDKEDKDKEKKSVPLITQYTKKITQEEMKKQLEMKSSPMSSPKASNSQIKPPKRAQLISVPRGQEFPKSSIVDALTKAQSSINTKAETVTSDIDIVDAPYDRIENVEKKNDEKSEPEIIDLESSAEYTK